jgi:ParB-like chromosome segregation protein Spo0J
MGVTSETVVIDRIVVDHDVQPRQSLNESAVQHYQDLYENSPGTLPAVRLHEVNGDYYMCDGFTRLEAAKRAGLATLSAKVVRGSTYGALLIDAYRANGKHGQPLTQTERRLAVQRLAKVLDESGQAWKHKDVADIIGVSTSTVQRVIAKLGEDIEERPLSLADVQTDVVDEVVSQNWDAEDDEDDLADESPVAKAKREQVEEIIKGGRQITDAVFQACRVITAQLNAAKRTPGCENVVANMHELTQAKDTLLRIKEMRPEKVCPECSGFGCHSCKERGWITFNESKRH